MKLTTLTLGTCAALAIALGACGGDDSAAPTPSEGGSESASAPADCSTPGKTVMVDIPEFAFAPDPVEVTACDEVVWSNTHDQAHTSTGNGDQKWSTGNIQAGGKGEPVVFETSGTFSYICALHPFMKGTVEVS